MSDSSLPEDAASDQSGPDVGVDPAIEILGTEFESSFGESLSHALDIGTWHPGGNLANLYERLSREVAEAVKQEVGIHKEIRDKIFPSLATRTGAPPNAGVFRTTAEKLELVHRKLLFNGGVEACDGTVVVHDTLPVTITQIGVCLVSYRGDQGSWVHRLFRRDLRSKGSNPVEEVLDMLDRRRSSTSTESGSTRERLSSLARRGIMAYAERAVLMDRSSAVWRLGHGSPTPYELITGSGMIDLVRSGIELMNRMVLGHQKFVFVPSVIKARDLLTIGNALEPLEYAIVDTNQSNLDRVVSGHYRGEGWGDVHKKVKEFAAECGRKIVIGLYRVSQLSPCQMFFAHVDHAHEAALIAMADSALQEHRGFPMLIDLAEGLCRTTFGSDSFAMSANLAYAEAGKSFYRSQVT